MRTVSGRGRAIIALAATMAVAGLSAGCGAGGSAGTTAAGVGAPTPAQVRIGMPTKLVTVDPDLAINEVDVIGLGLLSGTLLEMLPGHARPTPALASRCDWTANRLAYRCTLRPGLRFSDGSPLTVADVVATYRRALSDRGNVNSGLYAPVKGVRASGRDAVEIDLRNRFASLPVVLTEGPFAVMPAKGIAQGRSFLADPVFAGPYRLASRALGADVTFERNPYYGGPRPVVQRVEFVTIEDPNTRLVQLRSGQIDIAHELPPQLIPQVTGSAKPYVVRQYGSLYLYMNDRRGPLANANVRKAISAAIDREQLNSIIYGGRDKPLGSFLPSNMLGHDPSAPVKRDVARARALLAGTPCAHGCTIGLMVREGFQPYDQMSVIVQQQLAAVGIKVQLQPGDQSVTSQREQDGNFDMEVSNLYDVVNVPDAIMLTYGLQSDGGIDALFSGYKSPEMDAAIQRVRETDGAARLAALKTVNAIFARDLPYVPLLDYATVIGSRLDPRAIALGASGLYQVGREVGSR